MMHGADGHQATATRNLIHRDSASADGVDGMVCNVPSQHYAQSVLDNAQRQRRGGLPAYEALRELCDGLAIEQRIILYLEADPAIDPAQYSRGYQLPQGAMQMVVFATPAMIDAAVDLDEIGVDTKHRTNEDKGCVQAIMWFKQRTQSTLRLVRFEEYLSVAAAAHPSMLILVAPPPPLLLNLLLLLTRLLVASHFAYELVDKISRFDHWKEIIFNQANLGTWSLVLIIILLLLSF
jgi:hypothetical protein